LKKKKYRYILVITPAIAIELVGGKLSRRDRQFIRSLALKAFSNELSKILAKCRGGIKRVGELVRATCSFKLRNVLKHCDEERES
jgi:hypothetical protein